MNPASATYNGVSCDGHAQIDAWLTFLAVGTLCGHQLPNVSSRSVVLRAEFGSESASGNTVLHESALGA